MRLSRYEDAESDLAADLCSTCAERRDMEGRGLERVGWADGRDCCDCGRLHDSEEEIVIPIPGDPPRFRTIVLQHGLDTLDLELDPGDCR